MPLRGRAVVEAIMETWCRSDVKCRRDALCIVRLAREVMWNSFGGPTYLRGTVDDVDRRRSRFLDYKEALPPSVIPDNIEYKLHVTGLREKRLWILLICLAVLTLITVVGLLLNIFIIHVLDMSTRGMKHLQFHSRHHPKTGKEETVLQFSADDVHLGKVVAKSGTVYGSVGKDLAIVGSRVIIGSKSTQSRLVLQDGTCRFENNKQFIIKNAFRPYFSAQHPMFRVDKRIKKISTAQIITDKIRSPINDNLYVDVVNLGLRGNEGVYLEAKRMNLTARTGISLQTTADGIVLFSTKKLYFGNSLKTLPLSSSPSLTASIDALRVCVCMSSKPKLFAVPGNKPCYAPQGFCT
uniref:Beta-sarcoglycan n=1 Tax=Setaria digitata TaxID=48799 RepID=A0A915PX31_9BILA